MNFAELSDFEINQAVAKELGYEVQTEFQDNVGFTEKYHAEYPDTVWVRANDGVSPWEQKCWTGSPEDAWPVVQENKIAVMPDADDTWKAGMLPDDPGCVGWSHLTMGELSPFRAAMIVFLKSRNFDLAGL